MVSLARKGAAPPEGPIFGIPGKTRCTAAVLGAACVNPGEAEATPSRTATTVPTATGSAISGTYHRRAIRPPTDDVQLPDIYIYHGISPGCLPRGAPSFPGGQPALDHRIAANRQ